MSRAGRLPKSSSAEAGCQTEVGQPHENRPGAQEGTPLDVALLPVVENVVFPRSIYPLTLAGEHAKSLAAACEAGGLVALFLQRDPPSTQPATDDLYDIGTLARLASQRPADNGLVEVTVEGLAAVRLLRVTQWEPHARAEVTLVDVPADDGQALTQAVEQVRALYRSLLSSSPAAEALLPVLEATRDPADLAYLVAATIPISADGRQAVLEATGARAKLLLLQTMLGKAHEARARQELGAAGASQSGTGSPRLNQSDQAVLDRMQLEQHLAEAHLPAEAERVARRELGKLAAMTSASPDFNIVRSYLQWLCDLPWIDLPEPDIDLDHARSVLDRDHFGLDDVKQRIIEYLAVRKLRQSRLSAASGASASEEASSPGTVLADLPVLCLVGPPGVGKTSLGRSIARALQRPFVRISLGGITDEAELRGHRRTYVGAMPGRIVQSLARVQSNRPVVLLDELDKMGSGAKGDPTAALLDVLDPEQQIEFIDHYIEVPFDLSSVFFIATANSLDQLPEALRDRLEVIRLAGYMEEEKVQIALRHIIPAQMEWHTLTSNDIKWETEAVLEIIRGYTRESGVRQLEREVATVCRRVATRIAQEATSRPYRATPRFIARVLGIPRFLPDELETQAQPGIATGAFWTPVGGEIMYIEAITMPGSKTLTITGQLGDVMRESAQAALSYVRARANDLGIEADFYENRDIHVHVPSGAVAKDGPSAGITMAVSMISLLTGTPVSSDIAMSGEITLRGRVLPVGGIKEKVLAARRAGLRKIILPAQNRRDLDELQAELLGDIQVMFADNMADVLNYAFSEAQPFTRRKPVPRGPLPRNRSRLTRITSRAAAMPRR